MVEVKVPEYVAPMHLTLPGRYTKVMNQSDAVAHFLSSPLGNHFRYVGDVWFVYDDGDWVLDRGNLRIYRAIANMAQELNWVQGGNDYMISRIRRELAVRLRTDRLPGRYVPWDDPEATS